MAFTANIHLTSYSLLLGSSLFQSFLGGPLAFRALPRAQFGILQSSIFPVYFSLQTALPALLAFTYPSGGLTGVLANKAGVVAPLTLVAGTAALNLAVIGPATTQCLRERRHQETRDGRKSNEPSSKQSPEMQRLNKKFGMLHGVSTLLNMATMVATIWYGVDLAKRLVI